MSISETAARDAALPPRFADALTLFGDGNHDEALVVCEQMLLQSPDSPEAIMLLGLISFELDEPVQAVALLTRAHESAPGIRDYAEALAAVEARLGNTTDALFLVKLATTLAPHPCGETIVPASFANFFRNIGAASPDKYRKRAERLMRVDDPAGAKSAAETQLGLTPGDPATLRVLAQTCRATGDVTAAIAAVHAVLHAQPTAADRSMLATLLAGAGRHDEAARADRLACGAVPDDADAARSRIVNLAHDPDRAARDLDAAAQAWQQRFATAPAENVATSAIAADRAGKPFSVGLLGNRFDDPRTAHMLAPVLSALKRRGVSLFVYSDDTRQSAISDGLGRDTRRWTSLKGVDPETAAAILRGDGIDIALDLTGFGAGTRLATHVFRPARVCLGWGGTALTAAQAFDWILTGPLGLPERHGPTIASPAAWPLPRTPHVYPAPPTLIEPGALPAAVNGSATFGTAMPLGAIGAATLSLWADLLAASPGARLLVANVAHLDDDCVARAYEQISHAGLRQRIAIVDFDDDPQFELEFWRHVDVAIDPQPIGSFSRTAQALWMGVPVIAIAGARFEGRTGAAALTAAGRSGWIAADNNDACARAADLLRDRDALSALRASLPASVAAAPLADADGLAEAMLTAFREMLVAVDRR